MSLGEAFSGTLEAARQGAEWAWADLYNLYAGPLTGYLSSRGASEPEDLASDVFLQVARKINDFQGDESSFRSWLYVIAHHRLIDERRARRRRPDMTELSETASLRLRAGDVEEEAVERLTTEEVRDLLAKLTDAQQEVLALRIIGGLTLVETGEVLGKNVGAIKATQHRAVEALKALMDAKRVTR